MTHPAYQFRSLPRFTRDEIRLLNQATSFLPGPQKVSTILNTVSDAFFDLDFGSMADQKIILQVRVLTEGSTVQTYTFNQPVITIGRIHDNNLTLKSPLVSKRHAEIVKHDEGYFLRDLKSNNGTLLNQIQLDPNTETALKSGDTIRIEPFEIGVELIDSSKKSPMPISFVSISAARPPQLKDRICVYFDILPTNKTALLVLDRESANYLVQKLITGQKMQAVTAWTDIESGLLEYLVCRILVMLNPVLSDFRVLLQKVDSDPTANQSWFAQTDETVELTFSAETQIGKIYPALFIPAQLCENNSAGADVSAFLERLPWLRHLTYLFAVRLGMTFLNSEQVSTIEEGDILLLEETSASLVEGLPHGIVEFRSTQLKRGNIRGSLICERGGECRITLERFDEEGLKHMAEANKKVTENQTGGGETVVAGLEIPVTVELARVNFTVEELSSIREGQIIELYKSQPEIVDLSVEGKVIGSGKLVDVEGKLGVRILKALKAK